MFTKLREYSVIFLLALQVALGASIVGFRLIVVLRQVSQSVSSFSFAIFLAAAKIHSVPTHTTIHNMHMHKIHTHTYMRTIQRLLLIK